MRSMIDYPKGWEALVGPLLAMCKEQGVAVRQVKEKFGGLRFYADAPHDSELQRAVAAAERASHKTCQSCGKPGVLRTDMPWVQTLCDEHHNERSKAKQGA